MSSRGEWDRQTCPSQTPNAHRRLQEKPRRSRLQEYRHRPRSSDKLSELTELRIVELRNWRTRDGLGSYCSSGDSARRTYHRRPRRRAAQSLNSTRPRKKLGDRPYNPHSRKLRLAPRFSPTPPSRPAGSFRNLNAPRFEDKRLYASVRCGGDHDRCRAAPLNTRNPTTRPRVDSYE